MREDATGIVRLSDVADVVLGSEIEEVGFRLNGINALACAVTPQPGANYIRIAEEFYKRLEAIKKQKGFEDIEFNVVLDATKNVKRALLEVEETPAQLLITVDYSGREVLIPLVDDFIVELNKRKKTLLLNLPEGLLDL